MIKMKKRRGLVCLIMGMTLAGCSGNNEGMGHNMHDLAADSSMVPIKVELSWSPEEVSAGDKVIFTAVVTQDGEPVDDAREVMFEITDSADGSSKAQIEGSLKGDGAYVGENTFEQPGTFTVTSHVTARTQHSMPSKELTIEP